MAEFDGVLREMVQKTPGGIELNIIWIMGRGGVILRGLLGGEKMAVSHGRA